MSQVECRRAVLALNSYTRWSLTELADMSVDDLLAWLGEAIEMHRGK